jgi:hypothetical protein
MRATPAANCDLRETRRKRTPERAAGDSDTWDNLRFFARLLRLLGRDPVELLRLEVGRITHKAKKDWPRLDEAVERESQIRERAAETESVKVARAEDEGTTGKKSDSHRKELRRLLARAVLMGFDPECPWLGTPEEAERRAAEERRWLHTLEELHTLKDLHTPKERAERDAVLSEHHQKLADDFRAEAVAAGEGDALAESPEEAELRAAERRSVGQAHLSHRKNSTKSAASRTSVPIDGDDERRKGDATRGKAELNRGRRRADPAPSTDAPKPSKQRRRPRLHQAGSEPRRVPDLGSRAVDRIPKAPLDRRPRPRRPHRVKKRPPP